MGQGKTNNWTTKVLPGNYGSGSNRFEGKWDLIVVKGTINSLKYKDILSASLPRIQRLCPRGFVFQQDGASRHTLRLTRKYFDDNKWNVSDWPANSPDLNPMENVWGIMKNQLELGNPQDLAEMEHFVRKFWDEFSISIIVNLFKGIPKIK